MSSAICNSERSGALGRAEGWTNVDPQRTALLVEGALTFQDDRGGRDAAPRASGERALAQDGEQRHTERVRTQVEKWRDELLDLTGRNRLLRFRHTATSSLEIQSPDAQAILDRLLLGRTRSWEFHLPEDPGEDADVDPTASVIGLADGAVRGSTARSILDALDRLGVAAATERRDVWLAFGAIRWREVASHTSALLLAPAEIVDDGGFRLRLRAHELVVNPALVAHFEREFGVTLGELRYRVESAGIEEYLASLREDLGTLEPQIDDRVGLLSRTQYEEIRGGALDVTPGVLISEGPRDGILGALAAVGQDDANDAPVGLPLVPASARVFGVPVRRSRTTTDLLRTTKTTARDVRAACAGLSRRAAQEFMDKGLWILYLGVGMLHWSDPADGRTEFQDSPLLLVPVRVSAGKGGEWQLLPTEEEPLVNPALWLKMEGDLGLELPQIDPDEPLDVAVLLNVVRDAVAGHSTWTVEERVVLSTFSFHKEAMYRDLRENIDRIVSEALIDALASEPGTRDSVAAETLAFDPIAEDRLDQDATPERAALILDADASQRQCVAAAKDGRSFVMDGPPGTGKSQTIANQIAELVAAGKTVLFVSEKAAALDVVFQRLANVGLDEYVLELHSHKTTRAAVANALGASLLRRPRPDPALTERDLDEAARRRAELTRYAAELNEPVAELGGRSLHHLLGWIAGLQHLPQAPVAQRPVADPSELATARDLSELLRSTWEVVERGEDFVWRGAAAESWTATVEQHVQSILEAALEALSDVVDLGATLADDLLLTSPAGIPDTRRLAMLADHVIERPDGALAEWLLLAEDGALVAAAARAAQRRRSILEAEAVLAEAAGPGWPELDAHPEIARTIRSALTAAAVDALDDLHATDARRLAGQAAEIATAAEVLRDSAGELAVLLGLRSTDLGLEDIDRAVEIAAIASGPERPDALWLRQPAALAEARAAFDGLEPSLVAEHKAHEEASAFAESVLELDLPALAQRFREEHRGLKKFGGAYRADRDALAATAPGLSAKGAVAQIDAALSWREARVALDNAAATASAPVGDAWQGSATDAAAVRRCLDAGTRAAELAGDAVADRARFANAVAGAGQSTALEVVAARAGAAATHLRSTTPAHLQALNALPLDSVAARASQLAEALARAANLVDALDGVARASTTVGDALAAHSAAGDAATRTAEGHDDQEARDLLGPTWSARDVDPDALDNAIAWTLTARASLASSLSRAAAARLTTLAPDPRPLSDALVRWDAARDAVLLAFQAERRADLAENLEADADDARSLLQRLRDTRGDIETWTAYARARRVLADVGLEPALRYCAERRVRATQLVDILRRSLLEATADAQLAARADTLGALRSLDRDRLVRDYAAMDRQIVGDAAHRVMRAANERRPSTIMGIATIIANEAQKKKRHMPVAQLLARTADVAQAIKPCFMMSPLSVSQFLSPTMRFDVVIFDEASQVRPCDAINALYRSEAMIVAGDQKQLPPTSFFEQSTEQDDEWTEDSLAEFDSVLDLAKGSGAFRSLSLRWHYRSRHEDLIAFSNHRFYGGDLVTFPSPSQTSHDLGVELFEVEGVYRRGTSRDNPIEARTAVERVFFHAERGARSLGVVAFNEPQASLIEELLRLDPRSEDPRFAALLEGGRLDGLFIKNLENVQGDERDTIIFSVGYGPDEHGKLTMNFGPMNREGGWRRLNVAITRARKRVELICSFGPERLERGGGSRGVDELRRYLEFARRGPGSLVVDDGLEAGGEPESPFEEAVLQSIRSWGYDVVSQVGTAGYRIDMAVRHPRHASRFAIGIECDGAMYHSSKVARDRDRLREQVLIGLGWTLHRIWGPAWYRDRPGEERRLREAIERALLDAPSAPVSAPVSAPIVVDFDDLDLEAPPLWAEPYTTASLATPSAVDVADVAATTEVRRLLQHVVAEEGPIVEDLLVRRVIGAWGAMVTERRRRAVDGQLAQLTDAATLVVERGAYRLPNQRTDLVRIPVEGDERTEREVKHVPDVELAEALHRLVADARLVTGDEALVRTARLFGWRRSGSSIRGALTRVIEQLLDERRITRDGDYLRAIDAASSSDETTGS
jgi:very-short-patch-repair endonuclease